RKLAGERGDIRWHGRFAPQALDSILDAAEVLVVPSLWYENRPLTIQDALRRGVPVLASDLGGMAELIRPGFGGLLFPHGDAGALADLLAGLAADRPHLLALARARPALPGLEEVADRHAQLYAAALAGTRSVL
ncbi:MAG: glycosyltransferase, partial [Planctomycetota bacterium]